MISTQSRNPFVALSAAWGPCRWPQKRRNPDTSKQGKQFLVLLHTFFNHHSTWNPVLPIPVTTSIEAWGICHRGSAHELFSWSFWKKEACWLKPRSPRCRRKQIFTRLLEAGATYCTVFLQYLIWWRRGGNFLCHNPETGHRCIVRLRISIGGHFNCCFAFDCLWIEVVFSVSIFVRKKNGKVIEEILR